MTMMILIIILVTTLLIYADFVLLPVSELNDDVKGFNG